MIAGGSGIDFSYIANIIIVLLILYTITQSFLYAGFHHDKYFDESPTDCATTL
jgi:hypothetical protein